MTETIAHRGASAYAPEHTAAGYDLALELGADRLELDVRPLADGTPVVVHDPTLRRTCGDPREVAHLMPADLEALDPRTRPLRLDEVLARYGRETRYLVELKDPSLGDARRVAAAVRAHGLQDRVVLQSFDHAVLRRLGPALPRQPLYPPRMPARWVRMDLKRVGAWACGIAPCATSVDAAVVRAAHARGLAVHAYTVNDPVRWRRLTALGVDGIITDRPDLGARTLAVAA